MSVHKVLSKISNVGAIPLKLLHQMFEIFFIRLPERTDVIRVCLVFSFAMINDFMRMDMFFSDGIINP